MADYHKTIAAISTPPGMGAVGMVRISGPEAPAVGRRVFRPMDSSRTLDKLSGYTGCLGRVFDSKGDIDEAVAFVYLAPKSYTGEDVIELCCHGGGFLLSRVLQACLAAGAVPAAPGEFTKRAFLNGKLTLDRAESVMGLVSAHCEGAARAALAARDGALTTEIGGCADQLINLAAHLAAWVDYPEEDIPQVEEAALGRTLAEVAARLQALADGFGRGRILREGVDTVLAGRPNVGKSTLMNTLSGCPRSIVTEIPGTTRDVVEDTVRLGSLVLRLSDTAGLRQTNDPIEQAGVALTNSRLESCDLVLALFDGGKPLEQEDLELLERMKGRLCIGVVNKADLPPLLDTAPLSKALPSVVELSAKTGEGVSRLEEEITRLLGLARLDPAAPLLHTHRQLDCVNRALGELGEAAAALAQGQTLDALSVCVDSAIDALLELTGQRASAAVVDRVFHNFCVGK